MNRASDSFSGPPSQPGAALWLKKNLFNSWFNTLLTIVSVAVISFVVVGLGR